MRLFLKINWAILRILKKWEQMLFFQSEVKNPEELYNFNLADIGLTFHAVE